MAEKVRKGSKLLVNLMYSASIILFLMFMFFIRQDARSYDPISDSVSIETSAYVRAVEFIVPGVILMWLAARKSHKERGE